MQKISWSIIRTEGWDEEGESEMEEVMIWTSSYRAIISWSESMKNSL